MSKSELYRLAVQRGEPLPDDGRREELITEKVVRLTKEIEQLNDKIKTMRKGMDHTLEQTQKNYHELEQQFYNSVTENKQLNTYAAMLHDALDYHQEQTRPISKTQEALSATEADVTKFINGVKAERDAEWMKEPVAWLDIENDVFRYRPPENWLPQPCIPIFAQPKEVK